MMRRIFTLCLLVIGLSCVYLVTQSDTVSRANDTDSDGPLPAREAASSMIVPEGFQVTLFAGEPDVRQPIGFCIDDRGRLWVAEAYNYPRHGTRAGDRIVILEDTDGDGSHDKRTVFYDKLNYVTGIEVGFGGAWVVSPPYFYFIPDGNGDDQPDSEPVVLLDGFGNHANAHNLANGLAWGPDGWLYGTHGRTNWSLVGRPGAKDEERTRFDGGVYRYHPLRHVWEPYCDGTTNPWGIDWDDYGQSFICNCVNPHLFHVIPGAHYEPWRNRKSSQFAYERIPTIADHLHFTGVGNVRDGIGSEAENVAGGGHAHCGTMVYLGDSWPARYRNTLFTNNIHGKRINNEILKRAGSGYVASHGPDILRSRDKWFMGVTLAYGPDGSVFVSDWSDTGECHSVRNTRRETGRIYKITYGTPQPFRGDISKLTDDELVQLQLHRNDWFVRHARRVLQERAAIQPSASVHESLRRIFKENPDATRKLRALWALHATSGASLDFVEAQLHHSNEHVRSWAIQLLTSGIGSGKKGAPLFRGDWAKVGAPSKRALAQCRTLAASGDSQLVRLILASTLQRLPPSQRWDLAEALLQREEDAQDANIPLMAWYGIEPLVNDNLARFAQLAMDSKLPLVRQHVSRRIAELPPAKEGLNLLLGRLESTSSPAVHSDVLAGILKGLEGRRAVNMPQAWTVVSRKLATSRDSDVQARRVRLALVFDDETALRNLRRQALDSRQNAAARRQAIEALVRKRVPNFAEQLLRLVEDKTVEQAAIRGLAEYNDPETDDTILRFYRDLSPAARSQAIQTLASRKAWATSLLDAVTSGRVPASDVSAFTARQIYNIGDKKLTARVTKLWGVLRQTPSRRAREIRNYRKRLSSEVLARGNAAAGRVVFEKLCSNCHRLFDAGRKVGPDLTGSQRTNLDYLLENLIDPSAAVSKDFQMEVIRTNSGRVVTGMVVSETNAAITIQTTKDRVVIPGVEIETRKKSDVSMMPEGQLKQLTLHQIRDLVRYLGSAHQVPLPPKQ